MFNTARTRLTVWYVVILMGVSLAFSLVIYRGMSFEVDRFAYLQRMRFERSFDELGIPHPPRVDKEMVQEMKEHIILVLLGINGVILIVFGGLSYLLAGITLTPIRIMVEDQNRFISDASHELKTPLTAMKSALEVYVRDPKLTLHEAKQVLKDNIHEVNRLQILSESLLKLSESQSGLGAILFAHVSIERLFDITLNQIKHIAEKKKIKVQLKELPQIEIVGNEEKLIELFTILLDNAIKYSTEETTISIVSKIVKKGLEVQITDKGIGIEEKDILHIFDRFYRSDSARSKVGVGGYGLGLPIAKKIIALHRGTIHIESKVDVGTTVLVWLPLI